MTIYLLNFSHIFKTSGVDRYLERLTEGFLNYEHINFVILNLQINNLNNWSTKKISNCNLSLTIPAPKNLIRYFNDYDFRNVYHKKILHLVLKNLNLDRPDIIHVHAINLIDLALTFKELFPNIKIITHCHCIPWKNLIYSHPQKFKSLYQQQLKINTIPIQLRPRIFTRGGSEWRAYNKSDSIICVTKNGKNFLTNIGIKTTKIDVIYNGDKEDYTAINKTYHKKENLKLLFVGSLTPAKGIQFLLEALNLLKEEKSVKLTVCGYASEERLKNLVNICSKDIDVVFTGNVSYNQLKSFYCSHDIGIITTLNEQCSFVAIEMMKYGLPIITTLIDGLGEMFIHGVNCLALPITFSKQKGLTINPLHIAKNIVLLSSNTALRKHLGCNARYIYHKYFTQKKMIDSTIESYKKCLKPKLN